MRERKAEVKVILNWIGDDPFKEALLIAKAPIGRTTLSQMKRGSFVPSPLMISAIQNVISKYPNGLSVTDSYRATGS